MTLVLHLLNFELTSCVVLLRYKENLAELKGLSVELACLLVLALFARGHS